MIVKNESRIITRLLQSVLPIIDSYCICDTGSTDNTVELINTFFSERNIPGKVIFEPFKDFSHNRNVALESCVGMSDFVILLDADMILDIRNFNKNMLQSYDSFSILQGNDHFYYLNKRILRNNGLYNYACVTHEYVNTPSGDRNYDFKKNELFIIDIGDGGAKSDKFERDIRLLLNGIKEEPNNVRYYFYLANTYKDSGKFQEAITYYKKRIDFGGWEQEVWQSMYRIGFCYKDMGDIQSAIYWWLNAYELIPERIENLYQIIKYYRENSKRKLALQFYKMALNEINKNLNRDHYLFLENDIYTYKIFYEYTIFSYYLGIKNIDYEVIKILNTANIDENIYTNLLNNFKFYATVLKPLMLVDYTNEMEVVMDNVMTKFRSSSSCLIPNKNKDGYLLNVRYVNYYITENGYYIECDKHIATINKTCILNRNFHVKDTKLFDLNFVNRRYVGIEDIKIFQDIETDNILFAGTGFHQNNTIGIVTGNYDVNSDKLIPTEATCSFNRSDCEKNWVYVDYKNATHMIYRWNPLQISKLNEDKTKLNLVESKEMPAIFSRVRGSSNGFKYHKNQNILQDENIKLQMSETEIWFVVHYVSYESPRHYFHGLVVFDENMNLLRYSPPFKFQGDPIEYCLSVVVEDDRVIMNYSGWDRTTKIAIYDKEYIDSFTNITA
jgi:tetratricopeptide (TPR) repeat protein